MFDTAVVWLLLQVADEIISDFATIKQNSEKPLNDNEVYISRWKI